MICLAVRKRLWLPKIRSSASLLKKSTKLARDFAQKQQVELTQNLEYFKILRDEMHDSQARDSEELKVCSNCMCGMYDS